MAYSYPDSVQKKWCPGRVIFLILLLTQKSAFFPISYSKLAHNGTSSPDSRFSLYGANLGQKRLLWGKFGANFYMLFCHLLTGNQTFIPVNRKTIEYIIS